MPLYFGQCVDHLHEDPRVMLQLSRGHFFSSFLLALVKLHLQGWSLLLLAMCYERIGLDLVGVVIGFQSGKYCEFEPWDHIRKNPPWVQRGITFTAEVRICRV